MVKFIEEETIKLCSDIDACEAVVYVDNCRVRHRHAAPETAVNWRPANDTDSIYWLYFIHVNLIFGFLLFERIAIFLQNQTICAGCKF